MAAKRIEYQIVGRYKDGKEVTDYHLQSIDTGKSGKFSKEIVCYLAGRGQITNCTAQIYKDQVILRGNGMSLDDLPIINEDGELKNSDGLGKIKRGTSAMEALEMYNIVGIVKAGRSIAGYVLQNAGCGIKKFKRTEVLEMAKAGKIGNARVQMSNGREILRGIDCKLDELPIEMAKTSSSRNTKTSNSKDANTDAEYKQSNLKCLRDGSYRIIANLVSKLPYPMSVVIDEKEHLRCEYDSGYVDMQMVGSDKYIFNLSINNGFYTNTYEGTLPCDMKEFRDWFREEVKHMRSVMIH